MHESSCVPHLIVSDDPVPHIGITVIIIGASFPEDDTNHECNLKCMRGEFQTYLARHQQ